MKYKVGDSVRVRKDLQVGECYGDLRICEYENEIIDTIGKIFTINKCDSSDDTYKLGTHWYSEEMLEDVVVENKTQPKVKLENLSQIEMLISMLENPKRKAYVINDNENDVSEHLEFRNGKLHWVRSNDVIGNKFVVCDYNSINDKALFYRIVEPKPEPIIEYDFKDAFKALLEGDDIQSVQTNEIYHYVQDLQNLDSEEIKGKWFIIK